MPLIKARTRGKQLVRHITRLDRETNETLYAYAHFLGEPTEYVLNQLVDGAGKDRSSCVATEHRVACAASASPARPGAVPPADRCQRTFRRRGRKWGAA
jgi:hypothetical protein